jgi:hypothetical protein
VSEADGVASVAILLEVDTAVAYICVKEFLQALVRLPCCCILKAGRSRQLATVMLAVTTCAHLKTLPLPGSAHATCTLMRACPRKRRPQTRASHVTLCPCRCRTSGSMRIPGSHLNIHLQDGDSLQISTNAADRFKVWLSQVVLSWRIWLVESQIASGKLNDIRAELQGHKDSIMISQFVACLLGEHSNDK